MAHAAAFYPTSEETGCDDGSAANAENQSKGPDKPIKTLHLSDQSRNLMIRSTEVELELAGQSGGSEHRLGPDEFLERNGRAA